MPAMVRLGKLTLDAPFFQAGLAGYSDTAMRLVARRHGAPYCVTEAMLDVFLTNGGKGLGAAQLDDEDHPIAGQLMGSHPADIAAGAKVLLGLGYDVIDVNLACPVKKIKKKCRGGHLLSAPDEAAAILDAVKQAVGDAAPCTVKLRRGSDDSPQAERNFYHIFESAIELGYAGAVVHGRTVEQKYVGPARWGFLKQLVAQYGRHQGTGAPRHRGRGDSNTLDASVPRSLGPSSASFVIGGSGDVECAADIFRMIEQTGVQLVSVARGCIGNPWLFTQARALMRGEAAAPPTIAQQADVLREHLALSVRLHGEARAARMMRKFGIKFSRHHPRADSVRRAFIAAGSLPQWHAVIDEFYLSAGLCSISKVGA